MSRPETAAVRLLTGEREPVRLATTATIATVTVAGVARIMGLKTIDGFLTAVGDRVLVKDQTDARINGIYTASEGYWQRAADARTSRTMQNGTTVHVQVGTANGGLVFEFDTNEPVIGTDNIVLVDKSEPDYPTTVGMASIRVSSRVDAFRTKGYYTSGDGGTGLYKRSAVEPTHGGKVQTRDGAWWELCVDNATVVNAYGAKADNTNASNGTDNTAFIQAMIDHVGYYRLGAGRYKITDTLTIQPTTTGGLLNIGVKFSGIGKEKSFLISFGMAGKAMFGPSVDSGLYRFDMIDHTMSGDADNCIKFDLVTGQVYKSSWVNLVLNSVAGPAFKATRHFASSWTSCSFSSTGDHSIEIAGGNSTVLTNCYAHQCGDDKAGFRVWTVATMISCVGVDKVTGACYWGWFGVNATSIYQIEIIGGNAEDFGTAGINLEYSGQISIANLAFVARATGTYETFIRIAVGTAHSIFIRGNNRITSKGATRSGNADIQGAGAAVLVENNSASGVGAFAEFYDTTASLLYDNPVLQVRGGEFSEKDLQITRLKSGRESGFVSAAPTNITANAATYAMAAPVNLLLTANTGATSLTNITGGIDGQKLTLMIKDAFTTVRNLIGGAGRFELLDAVDRVCVSGEVLEFVYSASIWRQVSSRKKLRASATVDPASLALNACTAPATITVTGAVLGDFARASFSLSLAGASLHAYVSAADTVTYFFRNDVGTDPLDLGSGTLRVEVSKA
ncbi:MAG: hypothetical protein E5X65_32825 [Mesorhizobium sp.]|nr:MAG: hypothetical protein E5X65_32825 [Mesorhizobium sp.]